MDRNKVRVEIGGSTYTIMTEDDIEYVEELGLLLDSEIKKALAGNARLSFNQAAVLVALDFADQCKKATASADNLRAQMKDYLEDSARAHTEVDFARREIDRLNKEISALRTKLAEMK